MIKVSAEDLKEGDTRITNAAQTAQEKIGTQAGLPNKSHPPPPNPPKKKGV